MAALVIHLRRRLSIAQISSIFVSDILHPHRFTLRSTSGAHSLPLRFSKAFRQTLTNTCSSRLQNFRFSTLGSSCIQKRYDIIDFNGYVKQIHEDVDLGAKELIELTRKAANLESGDEALNLLDKGGGKPSVGLIFSAILGLRNEWKLAYLVFKWGEKWDCVDEKSWCLMIWVLGNHRKFGTAWSLIHDLRNNSKDPKQAIITIIDRYAATNSVDKAMKTFKVMEKVSFNPDQEAFFTFLNILCKHGNIEEAEEFMYLNKKFFPLETEGFNIILNGWCNIDVDIFEAKRVWREMSKVCILPNGTSYTYLISCFSKVGNLFDSLRLYDEMKKRGFVPGIEVYNSLTYVLASQNCLKEALAIVDKIKEAGLTPDCTTYNSIISSLCEAGKVEDAKTVLAMMIEDNVSPTVDTYHALLMGVSLEEALEVLQRMRKAGLGPDKSSFIQILGRFFKLKQPESALKVWERMLQYEIVPDVRHYTLLVKGLADCELLVEARGFYKEMRSKGFPIDPELENLLKEPVSNGNLEGDHTCKGKDNEKGNLSFQENATVVRKKGPRTSGKNVKTGRTNSLFAVNSKR